MKDSKIGGSGNTHGRDDTCKQNNKIKAHLQDEDINGKIILRRFLRSRGCAGLS